MLPPVEEVLSSGPDTTDSDRFFEMLIAPCRNRGVGHGFGSGCGDCDGERPLPPTPITFGPVPMNLYVRFRAPGTYTCVASSADVTATSREEKMRLALLVSSKPIVLKMSEDPVWADVAAKTYGDGYARICRGDDVVEKHMSRCFDLASRITYLDTVASLEIEVRSFDGKNSGWDNRFWAAIEHSSYPQDALRLMARRIQDPNVAVSGPVLESLAIWDLRLESPDAFQTAPATVYHGQAVEVLRKYVRLLGSSLARKNSDVLAESTKTYLGYAKENYCDQTLIPEEERKQALRTELRTR